MEHLGVATHLPRVPYVVTYQYDFKGFHTFPDRASRCHHGGKWERNQETHSCPLPGPLACAAAFLQAWLFFGLLAEVLGPGAHLKLEDFYVQDDHGSWWITTKNLPGYLEAWKALILTTKRKSLGDFVQAQLALDEARFLVSKYCSANGDGKQSWEIDSRIALSFLVLGETLSHAKSTIVESAQIETPGWLSTSRHGWGYGKVVLQEMRRDQWCPRSMHILQGLFQKNIIGLLYAMRLSHPKALDLDHRNCDTQACKAREHASLSTWHRLSEDTCLCRHVGPNLQTLTRYIRDGKLVVLKYVTDEPKVEVMPYEENMKYVILSHVCADGFGNSESNTLPLCRLEDFVKVFNRLSSAEQALKTGGSFDQLQTPIYFWIDTLAIPIGNEYQDERRKAIQNMHEMYTRATYTIVLDAGLMTQDRGSSYAETAMKIAMCYWITRLWTLQEAYLSKRLLFNFADTLVDMDELERMNKDNLISPISLLAQNYHLTLLGRERDAILKAREIERSYEAGRPLTSKFLVSLWNALRWRSTSHKQHETLAMAILLQIDTTPFDDAMISARSDFQKDQYRLDQKMQILLTEISRRSKDVIPAELVFLPGPKLSKHGFRWAPRTWLHGCDYELREPISSQQTELTLDGLQLCCPGFRLHCMDGTTIAEKGRLEFPTDSSLTTWIIVQDADETSPHRMLPRKNSFAIVTRDQEIGGDLHIAILVAIVAVQESRIYAHILKRVWIRTAVDIQCIGELRKTFQRRSQDAIFGEVLAPNQKWCLDGAEQSPKQSLKHTSWGSSWVLPNDWLQGWKIRSSMPQKV